MLFAFVLFGLPAETTSDLKTMELTKHDIDAAQLDPNSPYSFSDNELNEEDDKEDIDRSGRPSDFNNDPDLWKESLPLQRQVRRSRKPWPIRTE